MRRSRSLILVLALAFSGCAARPVHPGSANSFDSGAYDSLIVAHNIIETTKQQLSTSAGFPSNIAPAVRNALSYLIDSYNVADKAYIAYHEAALNGVATQTQADLVSASLADVNTKTTALTAAKNGKL